VALLLSCAAFTIHNVQMVREAKKEQITALADILGSNATTALEFNDSDVGSQVLSSLRLQPSVEEAVLFDSLDERLASYPAKDIENLHLKSYPELTQARFSDDGYLVIAEEIYRNGEKVGTVYIRSNLDEIGRQLQQIAWIGLVVTSIAMGVALLVTARLQRLFTAPIHELAEVMQRISTGGDVSQHVKKHGQDEMGVLCDGFNQMLDQINTAQAELQSANEVLEERVVERTKKLQIEIDERAQAEEAVREAREFLHSAVAQTPSGILIADAPDVTIRLANDAALAIRGGNPADLIDINVSQLADRWQIFRENGTPYPSEHLPLSRAVLHGEKIQDEELIIRDESGNDRWVSASAAPILNRHKQITAGIVVFQDITERKQAEVDLEETHQELLKVTRLAGMSEIATGVLHNVGNVLNSVNVSANLISSKIRKSRVTELKKAGDIIAEHEEDMAEFVTEHPQGKHMANYMIEIGKHLVDEQEEMCDDLEGLRKNIEHIKEIVSMQQTYARVSRITEEISPLEMLEDALEMRSASFGRHGIEVVREYAEVPNIMAERHKLVQIFVNLVGNAKHAISDYHGSGGTLTLRLGLIDENRILFEVTDNGIGISEENLTKVFNYGFTTKKNGHGFGLHSSALAAKEMGGILSVRSEGKGTGATFALELPVLQEQDIEVAK
jgi:PAS domain S-box-containing protein